MAVCGDFNIAPTDRRRLGPGGLRRRHPRQRPEREALARLEDWGLVDAFRARYAEDRLYSYWDYRAGDFHEHRGMRIDLILVTGRWPAGCGGRSSTATPARASCRPTMPRCWSTWKPRPA